MQLRLTLREAGRLNADCGDLRHTHLCWQKSLLPHRSSDNFIFAVQEQLSRLHRTPGAGALTYEMSMRTGESGILGVLTPSIGRLSLPAVWSEEVMLAVCLSLSFPKLACLKYHLSEECELSWAGLSCVVVRRLRGSEHQGYGRMGLFLLTARAGPAMWSS